MDVADDVERPVIPLPVVPERLSHELDGIHLALGAEDVYVPKALTLKTPERAPKLRMLLADHMWPEVTIRARAVPLVRETLGHVDDNRDRDHVMPSRELDERLARLLLYVRGVDDHEASELQSLRRDVVQRLEFRGRHRLVVLVVRHQAAEVVRRQHFR